jgi:DNA-binding PadR family transcriptional regulator
MSLQHALLALLARDEPRHGYELKRRFDRLLSPGRPIPYGQVYAALARLEQDRRIVGQHADQSGGPERIGYRITRLGREALERWLSEPVEPQPRLQAELFTKVVTAILAGRPISTLLDRQQLAHLDRMRELTELRERAPIDVALLADYALFHLEADLRWIELTAARTDGLQQQVAAGALDVGLAQ